MLWPLQKNLNLIMAMILKKYICMKSPLTNICDAITILFRESNFECSFNSVSKVLQKNAKLCHISLDNLDVDTNQELRALVEQGLNERVVKPLDCKIFGHDQLAEAVDFKDKHRHQRVAVQVIVVTLLLVSLLWIRMTTPTVFISYFFCLNTEQ